MRSTTTILVWSSWTGRSSLATTCLPSVWTRLQLWTAMLVTRLSIFQDLVSLSIEKTEARLCQNAQQITSYRDLFTVSIMQIFNYYFEFVVTVKVVKVSVSKRKGHQQVYNSMKEMCKLLKIEVLKSPTCATGWYFTTYVWWTIIRTSSEFGCQNRTNWQENWHTHTSTAIQIKTFLDGATWIKSNSNITYCKCKIKTKQMTNISLGYLTQILMECQDLAFVVHSVNWVIKGFFSLKQDWGVPASSLPLVVQTWKLYWLNFWVIIWLL